MNTKDKLQIIFNPKTVAVIGASDKRSSVGYALVRNLIGSGFDGIIYPINPKRISVFGVRSYPSVKQTPDKIDLAIVATPSVTIPSIVRDCGEAGVEGMVIISAGFLEAGEEGHRLFEEVMTTAKKYGIRIIGPNCLGFIRPSLHLNASFANRAALPGRIAFLSQSGALCTSILDWSIKEKVGFSYFVSVGSMGDIGFHDLIDYCGQDPNVSSILIYMESLTNAKRFLSAARAFARTKPIIVLKVGRSQEGAKAAMSHTGSLSGDDAIFNAAFDRAGIIRVNTISDLFNCAKTLSMQPRPRGRKLAIVTNAGGPGVIATDTLIDGRGKIAELSPETISELDKALPAAWSKGNPVDVLGDADPTRYRKAVELCLNDSNTDAVLVILTPQAMTDARETAVEITKILNKRDKTILTAWMGADDIADGKELLEKGGIPVFAAPEEAVNTFLNMYHYFKNLQLLYETPSTIPGEFVPNTDKNRALIRSILDEGRLTFNEREAKSFLKNYEIPVTRSAIAKSEQDAYNYAQEIGYPLVMKILSPDILHKTDIGGVSVNIMNPEEARNNFRSILSRVKEARPDATIDGILIEEMVKKEFELFIGCKKDPIFGPVIVFGLGGVAVEVYKDVNVALPPLNMHLASMLIEDTKISVLLKGYRGMKGVQLETLQFLLYKFAYLIMDFPEIKEIDINPFCMDETGGIVLDAKIILDEEIAKNSIPQYSHLCISPYPKEYIEEYKLRDGRKILLRPIKPEDEPMEAEMFRNFSEQTQRFRFFQLIRSITHEMLIRYTQIDYDREIAIIAAIEENGKQKMAGVVRLIADPYNENAEFAIVVADPWHNLGLGNKLTDYVLKIADDRKIKKIYANFLKENFIMRHIFEKRGFNIFRDPEGDYYTAELDIV